jgi:hypothetical protein
VSSGYRKQPCDIVENLLAGGNATHAVACIPLMLFGPLLFVRGQLTFLRPACFVPLYVIYDCADSMTLTKQIQMHPKARDRFFSAAIRHCCLFHAASKSFVVTEFVNEGLVCFYGFNTGGWSINSHCRDEPWFFVFFCQACQAE